MWLNLLNLLIILKVIIIQNYVQAQAGIYNYYIEEGISPDTDKNDAATLMKEIAKLCSNNKVGVDKSINVNELSLLQIKDSLGEYTALSNLDQLTMRRYFDIKKDILILIPGLSSSVKKDATSYIRLAFNLMKEATDNNFFVLDVGENFRVPYEESLLRYKSIGEKLGEALAKIPTQREIQFVTLDIGIGIAEIASKIYYTKRLKKFSRISVLNPPPFCLDYKSYFKYAHFVDVYAISNLLYTPLDNTLTSFTFLFSDDKYCINFLCGTLKLVNHYSDPISKTKKYKYESCTDDEFVTCPAEFSDFGYKMKTDKPDNATIIKIKTTEMKPLSKSAPSESTTTTTTTETTAETTTNSTTNSTPDE